MQYEILELPSRRRLVGFCLIYAVVMLYSSTIIGPAGLHYVHLDPVEALRLFLATPYVVHGSDQRADWIGNMLMLVPFGFLVTGAVWPSLPSRRFWSITAALVVCAATILLIKYLQLYFPPRTVTLNYILAQTTGAVLGCCACAVWNMRIAKPVGGRDPVSTLVLALRLYTGALLVFLLMPLDFALDATDLRAQFLRLPATLFSLPGSERPLLLRLILIVVASAAFIPVGMLLTFVHNGAYRVRRGLAAVVGLGIMLTTGVYLLTALVISAFPVMPAILYRTGGIVVGAILIRWLTRQDGSALRHSLRRLVPWLVPPYLGCVLLANHLLSLHWQSVAEAVAHAYPLGLLPLFDYYIVTKAEAAKNLIGHAALYCPIGGLLWLRYGNKTAGAAFIVAAALSFMVEVGRYLRPGLEGDINAVFVAGIAAMLTARMMPVTWSMVEALARQSGPVSLRSGPTSDSPSSV